MCEYGPQPPFEPWLDDESNVKVDRMNNGERWASDTDSGTADLMNRMIEAYGEKVLQRSCMRIRGGAGAFQHFLEGKGYGTVLEIGTYRGVSAAVMSQFCERVITIDLLRGGLEQRKATHWDREKFWRSIGIKNIQFMAVGNDLGKASIIDKLDFDFAFIDGAHDERVALDYSLVKKCGRVLFHDATDLEPGKDYVSKFIATLPRDEVEVYDIFAMWKAEGVQ